MGIALLPFFLSGCMDWKDYLVKEQSFMVDFVGWIFDEIIPSILFTPYQFFDTEVARGILIKMGVFSGGLVTLLAMIEGFKRMLSATYTPMMQVFGRYPIALAVSAFAPVLFYYAGIGSNFLVDFMGMLTNVSIQGTERFASIMQSMGHHIMEAIVTFFLMVILGWYFMRLLIMNGVRCFGLIFNMVTTPIAMTAFMFKPYEGVASGWLKDTISKFLIVVVHAFLLGLATIILYAPVDYLSYGGDAGFSNTLVRVLTAIGGLHMMIHPPRWIMRWFDGDADPGKYGGTLRRALKLVASIRGAKS